MKRFLFAISALTIIAMLTAGLLIRPKLLTVSAQTEDNNGTQAESAGSMPSAAEQPAESADPPADNGVTAAIGAASDADGLDLGQLFTLDRLFDNDPSSLLDKGTTSLRDLMIIDYLFNGGKFFHARHNLDLGGLFTLDRLFGDGNGLLDNGTTSLSDLIILEELFNGGG